jgi:transposase-like protein
MPKTHPTYNSGFRQEAVNLLISGQRPLKAVAAELGVSANSLRTWRSQLPNRPKGDSLPAAARRAERSDGKFAACNAKTSIYADSARS